MRRCSDMLARNSEAQLSVHGAFEIMVAAAAVPGKRYCVILEDAFNASIFHGVVEPLGAQLAGGS